MIFKIPFVAFIFEDVSKVCACFKSGCESERNGEGFDIGEHEVPLLFIVLGPPGGGNFVASH